MSRWSKEKSNQWYEQHNWLVGCNYLPSNAINQLEMFQQETFDVELNKKELTWAKPVSYTHLTLPTKRIV